MSKTKVGVPPETAVTQRQRLGVKSRRHGHQRRHDRRASARHSLSQDTTSAVAAMTRCALADGKVKFGSRHGVVSWMS